LKKNDSYISKFYIETENNKNILCFESDEKYKILEIE
jgi:hypothetical protein